MAGVSKERRGRGKTLGFKDAKANMLAKSA
jgi:hypothetical protein